MNVIRGIDDPLLNECFIDIGGVKKKRHHRSYTCVESGDESGSDQSLSFDKYQVRGSRWVTKDFFFFFFFFFTKVTWHVGPDILPVNYLTLQVVVSFVT